MKHLQKQHHSGFTLIELMVVVAVLAILTGVSVIGYGKWRESIAQKEVQSDLQMAAAAMESAKNFSSDYPSTLPNTFSLSPNVVVEMTTQPAGKFCINGYSKTNKAVRMSVFSDNKNTVRDYLCVGVSNGSVVGGTVPATPTGVNIAPSLSGWTLSGTASYNDLTDELTLGSDGVATSPKLKVNGVAGVTINAQLYATSASAQSSITPNAGWHNASSYYESDGQTPAINTAGYTANGCAGAFTRSVWSASMTNCVYALGPNVTYLQIVLYSAASGYSSSDLKVKNITFTLY